MNQINIEGVESLNLIYFSPTKTTEKIAKEICKNLEIEDVVENNITNINSEIEYNIESNSLTIIAMPVYGGRLPLPVVEVLKKFHANSSPVVLVVVYGNRDFDDALLELKEIADGCGFSTVAGAAFIGEHSFSTKERPIAQSRPDKKDIEKCRDFSKLLKEKLDSVEQFETLSELNFPGNFPFKERKPLPSSVHPETDNSLCTKCEICVETCHTGAITINDFVETNGELCTYCCACVKSCPTGARIFDNPTAMAIKEKLFHNCLTRKEPQFFLI